MSESTEVLCLVTGVLLVYAGATLQGMTSPGRLSMNYQFIALVLLALGGFCIGALAGGLLI